MPYVLLRCEGPRVTECVVVAIVVNGCHRGRSSWSNVMVVVCSWFSYVRNGGIDALRGLGCQTVVVVRGVGWW